MPEDTYDIVFAGGGATACVAAGRLIAADPHLRVLILEAGPHTQDVKQHVQPAKYPTHLLPGSRTVTFNEGKPSPSLLGRAPIVPCGHAVGGGSSVNFMVYTRAAGSDYDDWENVYGNKGWGSDNLIPLLKKAETYQAEITNATHGTTGPIKISFSKEHINIGTNFLEVSAAYDKERGITDDANAFTYCNKYGRWARYIDIETGKRSDAAHHYIYNQSQNVNLKVLDNSRVIRVIFEGGRAVGVEYIKEDDDRRWSGDQPTSVVRASRLVVISAGAFGSPMILERSGIGAKEILDKIGIPHLVDLPGVGKNYMDHLVTVPPYHASDDAESMDHIFRGTPSQEDEEIWAKDGTGLLAQNGLDAIIKIRPTAEELATMSPEFDSYWETYFANAPDKPVFILGSFSGYLAKDQTPPIGKYFGVVMVMAYPLSTGHVHITSAYDPYAPLDFHPGYLDEVADVVTLRWVYKKSREHARRMKYYRGEIVSGHPTFPAGSLAATRSSAEPVEIQAPNIIYTKEDDDAIDKFHREFVATAWHSCGTCAMKPRSQGGVVDERLNVYGTKNLKVADMSIIPGNVGANTYNTAIAIGEKAAIIIAQDLGIYGKAGL